MNKTQTQKRKQSFPMTNTYHEKYLQGNAQRC